MWCNAQEDRGTVQRQEKSRIAHCESAWRAEAEIGSSRRLRSEGPSLRQIAVKLGVGYGTVWLSLARFGELKTPRKMLPLTVEKRLLIQSIPSELQLLNFRPFWTQRGYHVRVKSLVLPNSSEPERYFLSSLV
jgi:hypothetical protein